MRILVISDIHANLTALEAVLLHAGTVDAVWCLGDVVGYGPDPNECIQKLLSLPKMVCMLGNHDSAAIEKIPLEAFNLDARKSILWLQRTLTQENFEFLRSLPEILEIGEVTLVHGSPRNPVWEYILNAYEAAENFEAMKTRLCFIGHTHLPAIYQLIEDARSLRWTIPTAGEPVELKLRGILNGGSVGQPRDNDPRASYAIFNPELSQWTLHRVEYDIYSVQQRIKEAGLPVKHALRLADGW